MIHVFFLLFDLTLSVVKSSNVTIELSLSTSSSRVKSAGSISLTCTVEGLQQSNYSLNWHILKEPYNLVTLEQFEYINETETEFTYEIQGSTTEPKSGLYFCSATANGTEYKSNSQKLYFRNLVMIDDSDSKVIYKNQPVTIGLIRHGDSSLIDCIPDKFCPDSEYVAEYYSYSQLCFDAVTPVTINCSVTYGTEDNNTITIDESYYLDVKVPKWSEWGDFSDDCQIREDDAYNCNQYRNRECINKNNYSNCEGPPTDFQPCSPNDCVPYLTNWGDWGSCAVEADTCETSRYRFCISATGSNRTDCEGDLEESEPCEAEMCDRWTEWSAWVPCFPRGDSCVMERNRMCTLLDNECVGNRTETQECSRFKCAPSYTNSRMVTIKKSYQESFFLRCDVRIPPTTGFGNMEIQWNYNSQPVLEYSPLNQHTIRFHSEQLTERNQGLYECCVTNQFDTTCNQGWNVQLRDHGPVPSGKTGGPREVLGGSNVTLPCQLDGWKLEYEWFKDGKLQAHDAIEKWFEIKDMSKEDEGDYNCCAYDALSGNRRCTKGYQVKILENVQRKYLIITICVIILLIVFLVLYITCVHTTKMNSVKQRFRHVFERGHTKLYNGLDPYDGPVIQRSQSYLKRLSKSRPLSKLELSVLIEQLAAAPEPGEFPDNAELGMEFDSVPNNSITINKTPVGTESKNRYLNVLPNQHSRVHLPEESKDPTSTYINANYIRGYKLVPKEYIATQGPIPSTAVDFWRLVWVEKCRIVVMTTGIIENNRMKCALYWPVSGPGSTVRLGPFEVEQAGVFPSRYYTCSIVKLRKISEEEEQEGEDRIIYHMWYHSWPDFGVPEDTGPFLDFVECVRAFKESLENVPVCVHCSAGIGRTGTFVAVNLGIEQFIDNGKVDPLGYICQLRQDRGGMIQTLDQYTFVYRALHAYQLRLASRDPAQDELHITYGFHTLPKAHPLLPPNLKLPIVTEIEGSTVDANFVRNLTQTMGPVSRYSDSATSLNNLSPKASADSLNKQRESSKPLIAKQKRRSKVKSLFFPITGTKDKSKRLSEGSSSSSSMQDLKEAVHRSLSLNNVRFSVLSKSRESIVSRVSLAATPRDSNTSSKEKVSLGSKLSSSSRLSLVSSKAASQDQQPSRSSEVSIDIQS